jgi:hypothetical protein
VATILTTEDDNGHFYTFLEEEEGSSCPDP